MKNIIVAIIIGVSLIIASYVLKSNNETSRYQVIMNSGSDAAGLITIKYDTITGRTWRLGLPEGQWIEIKDYGWSYKEPTQNK